jgi:hypothetical protein
VTHIPHEMGPRAAISVSMATSPDTAPNSATRYAGNSGTAQQPLCHAQFAQVPTASHALSRASYC